MNQTPTYALLFALLFGSILHYDIFLGERHTLMRALPNAPPEICDNAIDDDLDGLIDLNDPDCDCPIAEPISLIPNPSFEDQNCCPQTRSELHCADTWIQASAPTTDYIHDCGFPGWDNLLPPRPFPDGDGIVGFRDGRAGRNGEDPQANWKEYAGACLLGPLRANFNYRFQFNVGFVNSNNSPPTNIVFFGTADCALLPFGDNDETFGCPTNGPGWIRLGAVPVAGSNNWISTSIDITPPQDITAIAIGPDCPQRPRDISLYYFFDNLVLAEQQEFEFVISPIEGHPCQGNFKIQVPFSDTLNYQWYKDGIALVGETSNVLIVNYGNGNYQTIIQNNNFCKLTKPFPFVIPVFAQTVNVTICEGESYNFHQQTLDQSGTYIDTIKTVNNCDSIVTLQLTVANETLDTVKAKIVSGEAYQIGPFAYYNDEDYTVKLKSSIGCDSLVFLQLNYYNIYIPNAFSPNNDGINDSFTVFGNGDITMIKELLVLDRWGNLLSEGRDFLPNDLDAGWNGQLDNQQAPAGVYVYSAKIVFVDGEERVFSGALTLLQ